MGGLSPGQGEALDRHAREGLIKSWQPDPVMPDCYITVESAAGFTGSFEAGRDVEVLLFALSSAEQQRVTEEAGLELTSCSRCPGRSWHKPGCRHG